jgi:hypothetical protein
VHRCRWIGRILRPAVAIRSALGTATIRSALIGNVLTLEGMPRPVLAGWFVPVVTIPQFGRHLDQWCVSAAPLTP